MLGHQLGQDFILGLYLLFQELDPLLLLIPLTRGPLLALKGGGSVLEKLLLPPVKDRRPQTLFFTELGNRHLVQQVAPEDGNFLLGGVILAIVFHTFSRLSYWENAFSISS